MYSLTRGSLLTLCWNSDPFLTWIGHIIIVQHDDNKTNDVQRCVSCPSIDDDDIQEDLLMINETLENEKSHPPYTTLNEEPD